MNIIISWVEYKVYGSHTFYLYIYIYYKSNESAIKRFFKEKLLFLPTGHVIGKDDFFQMNYEYMYFQYIKPKLNNTCTLEEKKYIRLYILLDCVLFLYTILRRAAAK